MKILSSLILILALSGCKAPGDTGDSGGGPPYNIPGKVGSGDEIVICKRAKACMADGQEVYADNPLTQTQCDLIHASRDALSCNKTMDDGKIDLNVDVTCTCNKICPPASFIKTDPENFPDKVEDQLFSSDFFSDREMGKWSEEQKFKTERGILETNLRANNFIQFKGGDISIRTPEQKIIEFNKVINDIYNGKRVEVQGYNSLQDLTIKEPEFRNLIREKIYKLSEANGDYAKKFRKLSSTFSQPSTDINKSFFDLKEGLKDGIKERRRISFKFKGEKAINSATIIPFPKKKDKNVNENLREGEERYCVHLPSSSRSKECSNYLEFNSKTKKAKLMPGSREIENLALNEFIGQDNIDKSRMEQCWKITECKALDEVSTAPPVDTLGMNLQDAGKTRSSGGRDEPQALWNMCDKSSGVTGNYSYGSQKCSKKRKISAEFGTFMNKNFAVCTAAGAMNAGSKTSDFTNIHIVDDGITGDSNHNAVSNHSVRRAIDVKTVQVTKKDGSKVTYSMKRASRTKSGPDREFFNGFRGCWDKAVKKYAANSGNDRCKKEQLETSNSGSICWEDKNHRNHMHLSLPYCPRDNFYNK